MKKLVALSLIASLAACSEPDGSDTADLAPDQLEADVTAEGVIGDSSEAPDMATVQLALDEACPTLRSQLRSSMCEAVDLGASFTCEFAFEGDPEGTERSLSISQVGDGWTGADDPRFCDSLARADAMAAEAADAPIED
jgi:hypothetical protein